MSLERNCLKDSSCFPVEMAYSVRFREGVKCTIKCVHVCNV